MEISLSIQFFWIESFPVCLAQPIILWTEYSSITKGFWWHKLVGVICAGYYILPILTVYECTEMLMPNKTLKYCCRNRGKQMYEITATVLPKFITVVLSSEFGLPKVFHFTRYLPQKFKVYSFILIWPSPKRFTLMNITIEVVTKSEGILLKFFFSL